VQLVGGDANLREIGGDLKVRLVGGDMLISNIKGNCDLDSIGGDLIFHTDFAPDSQYKMTVAGDVLGKVAADANVRFVFPSRTESSIQIPNAQYQQYQNDKNRTEVVLGSGDAVVEFGNIGGDLELISTNPMDEETDRVYDSSFPEDIAELITARVNEQIAPLLDRVKRGTERIQRHAKQTADRAKTKRQPFEGDWSFGWWPGPEKPKRGIGFAGRSDGPEKEKRDSSASEPVTNEERMAILQMVENKQISIEEAEKLLIALENEG